MIQAPTNVLALAVLAGPTLAATIPPEIILTDAGFRRVEDCVQIVQRGVWQDGHYWSVRHGWDCSAGDAPYGVGKAVWTATDADLMFLHYQIVGIDLSSTTGSSDASPQAGGGFSLPISLGGKTRDEDDETAAVSPIPLPSTFPFLIAALLALFLVRRPRRVQLQ